MFVCVSCPPSLKPTFLVPALESKPRRLFSISAPTPPTSVRSGYASFPCSLLLFQPTPTFRSFTLPSQVQGKLPHYLFGTETKLTQKLLRGQRRLPQTALHIVRQKSAWTSCKNITKIVRDLGKVLKPYPFQPILLLDVASSHLAKETMVCARRNGVQLLYIPAGCTDKIQPLDIAGFHPLKTHLKRKYQELRAGSCEGLIDPLAWLFEFMQCPSYFAGKSWKRTFESVGAAKPPDTAHLHTELRKFMDMPLHMPPGSKPSKEAMQSIWPERRRMAYAYTALL